MSQVQAPAPAGWRDFRGWAFVRLRPYRFAAGVQRRGQVLTRLREGPDPPPAGAEAWKPFGGTWSEDFGGRWLSKGDGRLTWEWL